MRSASCEQARKETKQVGKIEKNKQKRWISFEMDGRAKSGRYYHKHILGHNGESLSIMEGKMQLMTQKAQARTVFAAQWLFIRGNW